MNSEIRRTTAAIAALNEKVQKQNEGATISVMEAVAEACAVWMGCDDFQEALRRHRIDARPMPLPQKKYT